MMRMLGTHVTQDTADKFGIKIHSDIVHPGEHRMMMVLEAGDAIEGRRVREAVRDGRHRRGEGSHDLRAGRRDRDLLTTRRCEQTTRIERMC